MAPCVHAYVFSQGDYPLGVSHLILSWLCRDSGCSQISCEGSLKRTFLSRADVSFVMERWQIRGRVMRICCVNTFVSCGLLSESRKYGSRQYDFAYISCLLFAYAFLLLCLFTRISCSTVWNFIEHIAVWQQSFVVSMNVWLVHMVWHGWAATVRFWSLLKGLIKKINLFL